MVTCPCGSHLSYDECCGRFHAGLVQASTAEALMRARYSAYARRDEPYLLRTWHATTRPASVEFEPELRWTRLEIIGKTGGALFDGSGTVSFAAHYSEAGVPGVMYEDSRFVRENGEWLYVEPV